MRYKKLKKDTYFKINTIPYFPFALRNSSANAQSGCEYKKHKTCIGKTEFRPNTHLKISNQINFLSVLILYHPD
jgi:hypothetical protein